MSHSSERNIACLLNTYESQISSLRIKICEEGIQDDQYDDIWLLRFVMSAKGDVLKAEKNVKLTITWRAEKELWLQVRKELPLWIHEA
jgi:hypothetical protein